MALVRTLVAIAIGHYLLSLIGLLYHILYKGISLSTLNF